MKTGIFIVMAALALAIFAVPEAHGAGSDVDQRFSGSIFMIDVDEDTGNGTALANVIARGEPGTAHLDSMVVFGPVGPQVGCPVFGAELISQTVVETYSDGSLLTLSVTSGVICTADGVVFTVEVTGVVTGGTGRFEGASGTFEAEAVTGNSGLTGRLTADLD